MKLTPGGKQAGYAADM